MMQQSNIKKAVTMLYISQNEQVKNFALMTEASLEELSKADKEFGNSESLKTLYQNPEVKEIFILLYEVKGSKETRRRIGALPRISTLEERKQIMFQMANDLKVKIEFNGLFDNCKKELL